MKLKRYYPALLRAMAYSTIIIGAVVSISLKEKVDSINQGQSENLYRVGEKPAVVSPPAEFVQHSAALNHISAKVEDLHLAMVKKETKDTVFESPSFQIGALISAAFMAISYFLESWIIRKERA